MLLHRLDLGVERRHVLGAPVVGESWNPEPLEHLRPLVGPALLRVERNDAPGDEVVGPEDILLFRAERSGVSVEIEASRNAQSFMVDG